MANGKLNWGSIIMGAALVTGIAVAAAYLLPALVTTVTTTAAVAAVAATADAAAVAAVPAATTYAGIDVAATAIAAGTETLGSIGASIMTAVSHAAAWMGMNPNATLAAGAVVGAATGALVGKTTDGIQNAASQYAGR